MAPEMLESIPSELPDAPDKIYSLICCCDADCDIDFTVLAVSHSTGALLRQMLEDVASVRENHKIFLTHTLETEEEWRFTYETEEDDIEVLSLSYIIIQTPVLPEKEPEMEEHKHTGRRTIHGTSRENAGCDR